MFEVVWDLISKRQNIIKTSGYVMKKEDVSVVGWDWQSLVTRRRSSLSEDTAESAALLHRPTSEDRSFCRGAGAECLRRWIEL